MPPKRKNDNQEQGNEENKRVALDTTDFATRLHLEKIAPLRTGSVVPLNATTAVFRPNMRITRSIFDHPGRLFLLMIPDDVWDHITQQTSKALASKFASSLDDSAYKKYYAKPEVSRIELQAWFAIRLACYNNRSIATLRDQFADEDWPMDVKRFTLLSGSMCASFPTLARLL